MCLVGADAREVCGRRSPACLPFSFGLSAICDLKNMPGGQSLPTGCPKRVVAALGSNPGPFTVRWVLSPAEGMLLDQALPERAENDRGLMWL